MKLLSEFLHNLNFPTSFSETLKGVRLKENSSSWSVIAAGEVTLQEFTFNPSVISELENKLALNFERGAVTNGKVCFANTGEVRPDFRTTFTSAELLNYIYALVPSSETNFKNEQELYLPFPENPEQFWKMVRMGDKKKETL